MQSVWLIQNWLNDGRCSVKSLQQVDTIKYWFITYNWWVLFSATPWTEEATWNQSKFKFLLTARQLEARLVLTDMRVDHRGFDQCPCWKLWSSSLCHRSAVWAEWILELTCSWGWSDLTEQVLFGSLWFSLVLLGLTRSSFRMFLVLGVIHFDLKQLNSEVWTETIRLCKVLLFIIFILSVCQRSHSEWWLGLMCRTEDGSLFRQHVINVTNIWARLQRPAHSWVWWLPVEEEVSHKFNGLITELDQNQTLEETGQTRS